MRHEHKATSGDKYHVKAKYKQAQSGFAHTLGILFKNDIKCTFSPFRLIGNLNCTELKAPIRADFSLRQLFGLARARRPQGHAGSRYF